MVIRLALRTALRVIDTGDDRSVAEEIHFDILNIERGRFEPRILDVSQKFLLVAEFAVPFGIHKPAGNQSLKSRRIAVDLSFIPQTLQDEQLAFAWIGLLGGQSDRAHSQQNTAAKVAHFLLTMFAGIPTCGEPTRTIAIGKLPFQRKSMKSSYECHLVKTSDSWASRLNGVASLGIRSPMGPFRTPNAARSLPR